MTKIPGNDTVPPRSTRHWVTLVLIGLVAGLLSGTFGVGGGLVVVPLLVAFAGYGTRLAAGTSLATIMFPSLAGLVSYVAEGAIDWIAGLCIIGGAIVGAQIGSWLLAHLSVQWVRWTFVAFTVAAMVSLATTVTSRDATIEIHAGTVVALVCVGLFSGTLAGLIGVGGGLVIVPVLIVLFGASDLVAKGTSLLAIIPTALSGTIGNLRRGNVDLPGAAVMGIAAAATAVFGARLAVALDPTTANWLQAAFLLLVAIRMGYQAWQGRHQS